MIKRSLTLRELILVLLGLCLFQSALLWSVYDLPPLGQHVWRQVTGMAFARNFAFEDGSFFYPRQDMRVGPEDVGHIYHEFPLVYWIVSKFYQMFGYHNAISRITALCVNFLGVFAAYFFARGLNYSQLRSLAFTVFFAFSPLFLYYTTTLLPDLTALNYFLMGTAFLLASQKQLKKNTSFCLGIAFITLAILTKPSWVFYGLPLAWVLLSPFVKARRWPDATTIVRLGMGALFIFGLFYLQYAHSHRLYDLAPVERAVHAQLKIAELPNGWADAWRNLVAGIGTWFVEMNISWGGMLFFLTGLWLYFKLPASFSSRFWGFFILSFTIYACFFIVRFADHDYYLTATLPLAAALSSKGFEYWMSSQRMRWPAILLLLALPFLNYGRIKGRWFERPQVPLPLLEQAEVFQQHIPKDERVITVGDKTPITYLYYLDRKGINYYVDFHESFPETLQRGDFRWVLYNEKGSTKVPELIDARYERILVEKLGDISLYRLHPRSGVE